jgi:hypothetical protein
VERTEKEACEERSQIRGAGRPEKKPSLLTLHFAAPEGAKVAAAFSGGAVAFCAGDFLECLLSAQHGSAVGFES